MLWEKRTNLKQKRGYLYIRETIYERDKRTLSRKPKREGTGQKSKERWKYSKKKDIYCGKIIDAKLQSPLSFRIYIEETKQEDFLKYKTNSQFLEIIDDFTDYLLFIHGISEKEFTKAPKKAYTIASGYFSEEGIKYIKRFTINTSKNQDRELERFANRCLDCAIFDEEIIVLLFAKLLPDKKRLDNEEAQVIEREQMLHLRDFIKKEHSKNKE